jgi:hypothetical protein
MSLIPPEELQEVLLRHREDETQIDSERIGQLVQDGFSKWKAFHEKYSAEQKKIQTLNAGLAAWDDVYDFLCEYAGARPADGYSVLQFLLKEGEIQSTRKDARVVTFDGNTFFGCGDYAGAPVYGPGNAVAQQIGLNKPELTSALRRVAFPDRLSGSAHIRWPKDDQLAFRTQYPFGVLVFLKQALKMEQTTWFEGPMTLNCYVVDRSGSITPVTGDERAVLLRGIYKSTVRTRPDDDAELQEKIVEAEAILSSDLRRISRQECDEGTRYAAIPLFAGVVGAPGRD